MGLALVKQRLFLFPAFPENSPKPEHFMMTIKSTLLCQFLTSPWLTSTGDCTSTETSR